MIILIEDLFKKVIKETLCLLIKFLIVGFSSLFMDGVARSRSRE